MFFLSFGGQLVYVKEVCREIANLGHTVDIVTRQIHDPDWPEFSKEIDLYEGQENLRIVRIPFGGRKFLRKELLWDHLDEFTDNILEFYRNLLPDIATTHYGDGGLSGVLLKEKIKLPYTFTGHSLGAQKLDKLGMNLSNFEELESQYFFSKRIAAERLSMEYASRIITSTNQERFNQYAHPLYYGAVDPEDDSTFAVIPPGVNTKIFSQEEGLEDKKVHQDLERVGKSPFILLSSRLDEKKNHKGVVEAYAQSKELQKKASLGLVIRGVDDPAKDGSKLSRSEQAILVDLLEIIDKAGIKDRVFFFNLQSQDELAAAYRYFAALGSIFALTAFYEPFGLAPIEAAACGLPAVTTKFGGPSEIFSGGIGELVDPFDPKDIARGLLEGLDKQPKYARLQKALVLEKYTWKRTAKSYVEVLESSPLGKIPTPFSLDAKNRIKSYLSK